MIYKRILKRRISTIIIVLFFFLFNKKVVFAMEIDNGFDKYSIPNEYSGLIDYNFIKYLQNPINDGAIIDIIDSLELMFRSFGWWLLKVLVMLITEIENILYSVFTKLNIMNLIFTNDTTTLKGLIIITLFIGIMISGYKVSLAYFNGTEQNHTFSKLVKGLVGSIILVSTIGFIMMTLESFQVSYAKTIQTNGTSSIIEEVLSTTIVDVEQSVNKNKIVNAKYSDVYDINEFIYDRKHDVFKNKYIITDDIYAKQLESSETRNWWENAVPFQPNEYHLKYSFNFIKALIILIGFTAVLGLNLLKFIYNSFSQFINLLFLLTTNSLDLIVLEKRKVAIDKIIGTFFANIYIMSSAYILFLLLSITNSLIPSITLGMNPLSVIVTELFLYVGIFWLMLDGADIIQQLTGQDGGLTKTGAIIGALGGKKAMDSLSKNTKKIADSTPYSQNKRMKQQYKQDQKQKDFAKKMKENENANNNQSHENDNGYENAENNQSPENDSGYENANNNQSHENDNGYEKANNIQSQEKDKDQENANSNQNIENDNGYENANNNKSKEKDKDQESANSNQNIENDNGFENANNKAIWDFQHANSIKNQDISFKNNERSRFERNAKRKYR